MHRMNRIGTIAPPGVRLEGITGRFRRARACVVSGGKIENRTSRKRKSTFLGCRSSVGLLRIVARFSERAINRVDRIGIGGMETRDIRGIRRGNGIDIDKGNDVNVISVRSPDL